MDRNLRSVFRLDHMDYRLLNDYSTLPNRFPDAIDAIESQQQTLKTEATILCVDVETLYKINRNSSINFPLL